MAVARSSSGVDAIRSIRTSGFVDDVTFARNGTYGVYFNTGAEFDVYECLVEKSKTY